MYQDIEEVLQDLRRMLSLYGPFHPHVKRFVEAHWDEPGFRWRCVGYHVLAFFGML